MSGIKSLGCLSELKTVNSFASILWKKFSAERFGNRFEREAGGPIE